MHSTKNYYVLLLLLSFCLIGKLSAAATWMQLHPATLPDARAGASMAFDQATGRMILFGGQGGAGLLNDTWSWDGTNWTLLTPATSPPTRTGATMAFDQATGQMILFGGQSSSGYLAIHGLGMEQLGAQFFPATSPAARVVASMAFDPPLVN